MGTEHDRPMRKQSRLVHEPSSPRAVSPRVDQSATYSRYCFALLWLTAS